MRIEKLTLKHLEGVIAAGSLAGKRSLALPSLAPEDEIKLKTPPAPPAITEAEVKKAEQEGYRKGFLEGEKEGKLQADTEAAKREAELIQAVAALAAQVENVLETHRALAAEEQAFLPKLVLAAARKVAGDALSADSLPPVEDAIRQCVEKLIGHPKIVITVNEKLVEALEARLSRHFAQNHEPGEIVIHGGAEMAPADCRMEWSQGSAERDTEALWQEIEGIIARMAHERRAEAAEETTQNP